MPFLDELEVKSIKGSPRRSGLAEYVYDHIKNMLLDGRLHASENIAIEVLRNELGVSRQPVLDALKRLSLEGFVVILPQIGCRVREYERQGISDFFRLFAEGEALIAEMLALRAEPNDLAILSLISNQIGELRRSGEPGDVIGKQYRQLNRRLHFEMRRASRSVSVAEVVESLGDRSDFFIAASRKPLFADRLDAAHSEHEAIIAAVREKDAETAGQIMRKHILGIEARLHPSAEK